jgi:hypothetical protein
VNQLSAVDIEEFGRITSGNFRSVFRLDRLPQTPLDISTIDPNKVAILSWRWDIDPPTFSSTNVTVAIEQAARMGVTYLFFDLVSIDQHLQGEALAQSVANLASLYSTIPVIAAYDEKGAPNWLKTMRRPWINFEARAYKSNPTRITYVGHMDGQGTDQEWGFKHMLDRVSRSTFTNSILMILCNQNSMGDERDFKYMIPDSLSTLSLCHASMRRSDYLLSAALLAQSGQEDIRLNGDIEFIDQSFELYSFADTSEAGYRDSRAIILAGQKVATWYRGIDGGGNERRKLGVEADAEEMILSSIGAAGSDDAKRRRTMDGGFPASRSPPADPTKPDIEIVRVEISR